MSHDEFWTYVAIVFELGVPIALLVLLRRSPRFGGKAVVVLGAVMPLVLFYIGSSAAYLIDREGAAWNFFAMWIMTAAAYLVCVVVGIALSFVPWPKLLAGRFLLSAVAVSGLLAAVLNARADVVTPDFSTIANGKAWRVVHASAENVEADGKRAVRLTAEGDSANGIVGLALPNGLTFSTGTIEIDLKGKNVRGRSFLGVAFNVVDEKTFEAVYFRPFNFKADPPFRTRAVQYIAWPTNTWEHLRKTAPGQFENAVSPVPDPDGWFHARIEVTNSQVRVFVDGAKEPSLVTKRLSSGGVQRPAGLFVDSSDGDYLNLTVTGQ